MLSALARHAMQPIKTVRRSCPSEDKRSIIAGIPAGQRSLLKLTFHLQVALRSGQLLFEKWTFSLQILVFISIFGLISSS